MPPGKLYVIPSALHEANPNILLSPYIGILAGLKLFVVENIRSARRFIKSVLPDFDINACTFIEIDKHDALQKYDEVWNKVLAGHDLGLLSEAGSPGIADPGSRLVAEAHSKGIKVVPWIGPVSITLALMASGLNGQCFTFHGYLPSKSKDELSKKLKSLDHIAWSTGYSQIFIETPYRNASLYQALIQEVRLDTMLCIAIDLTGPAEEILVMSISDWKKMKGIDLQKRPAIYIMNRPTLI
jgi:16S rRNA (cytidine1402-2'-O)-methyltransferase